MGKPVVLLMTQQPEIQDNGGATAIFRIMPDFPMLADGSVTSPAGFLAAGIVAGLKRSGAPDMALLVSTVPATAAAAFTANAFAAAPVQYDRDVLAAGRPMRAVIVNSGNANACTGTRGLDDARTMARKTAECLKLDPAEVLVSSTGRIGVPMPMLKILRGIELAATALLPTGGLLAAGPLTARRRRLPACMTCWSFSTGWTETICWMKPLQRVPYFARPALRHSSTRRQRRARLARSISPTCGLL